MSRYTVLFRLLNEQQKNEIQRWGWNTDAALAYRDVERGIYLRALRYGLIHPAATLDCGELQWVFPRLQNLFGDNWTADKTIEVHTSSTRSMSNGDIVFDHDAKTFFRLVHVKYEEIKNNITEFYAIVSPILDQR